MDHVEPFPDNWTYLRIELNWLDRILATAIARQRKDVKEVNRIARSRADQVTSHWWKGLIDLGVDIASDSPAEMPRRRSGTTVSYQQQMEAKIRASQQQGIALGLPTLCQRLQLTTLEKNLVLIALAPEISRRYGRIYSYLQEPEQTCATELPTVDLILRLLCRTDAEWRTVRLLLAADSTLMQQELVILPTSQAEPFLAHPVKLSDPLVEYLLADKPDGAALERLLQHTAIAPGAPDDSPLVQQEAQLETGLPEPAIAPPSSPPSALIYPSTPAQSPTIRDPWAALVLPDPLLATLRHLCDRLQQADFVDQAWGFQSAGNGTSMTPLPGTVALLIGASGTGKSSAAQAIAQTLNTSLLCTDLALLSPTAHLQLLQDIATRFPTVLLLKSAQVWLGRSHPLPVAAIQQFLHTRSRDRSITLLSVERREQIKPSWRRRMTHILEFPMPDESSRLQLWQRAFPPQVPLATDIEWRSLAQLTLSGGEIQAIVREAAICAGSESAMQVEMKHLIHACTIRNIKLPTRIQKKFLKQIL
ncbi:MAG: ATP-binding protein [Leptolyngbyaceae cyanobacterium RU_5_1]|nr:ATP-binding protein [Leptolyngbyaceae cyanobacterium RU_5_1]